METVKRKFNVSYGYALEYAKDMQLLFVHDLADFTAFDGDLDADFAEDWLADITAAGAIVSDESVLNEQITFTASVNRAMKNCRNYYQEVKYFAHKAFPEPEDAAKLYELGFENYGKARASQTLMLQFMNDLFVSANKYAVELAAVGFDAAKIAQIDTLKTALETANINQNNFINNRPVMTTGRVSAYNKVWDSVTLVARAAKIVYRLNPEKYNQYLLPGSDEVDEALSLKGKVADTATGKPIANAQVTIVELDITAATDNNGKFAMGNIEPGNYVLTCTATGYTTVTITGIAIIEGMVTKQSFTLAAASP